MADFIPGFGIAGFASTTHGDAVRPGALQAGAASRKGAQLLSGLAAVSFGLHILKLPHSLRLRSLTHRCCCLLCWARALHAGREVRVHGGHCGQHAQMNGWRDLIIMTLWTQAYGAKNYVAVGVTLQRALLICLVELIALLPLWIAMEPVLLALGKRTLLNMRNVMFST
jgi:hypothetical protein